MRILRLVVLMGVLLLLAGCSVKVATPSTPTVVATVKPEVNVPPAATATSPTALTATPEVTATPAQATVAPTVTATATVTSTEQGTAGAVQAASTAPEGTFVVPYDKPSPVPNRPDVTACSGEDCSGTDPHATGCDAHASIQSEVEVRQKVYDRQGNQTGTILLGKLSLMTSDDCGGAQWAVFSGIVGGPFTSDLRVVESGTGLSTVAAWKVNSTDDAWSPQLYSSDGCVRAEVVVFDVRGQWLTSVATSCH